MAINASVESLENYDMFCLHACWDLNNTTSDDITKYFSYLWNI